MSRVLNKDRAPDRLQVSVSRSMTNEELPGGKGYLSFGQDNDYPSLMENLINGSVTGMSVFRVLSKFLAGKGLERNSLNAIKVGRDINGKEVTVRKLISIIAEQIAKFNGVFIHTNRNAEGYVTRLKVLNFPKCRLSKPDDLGYSSKVIVSNDWNKKKSAFKKDSSLITVYETYQTNNETWRAGLTDLKNNKGQIHYLFLNNTYSYPLSTFDSVALDMALENEISEYRYNEAANGFTAKTIVRVSEANSDADRDKLTKKIQGMVGGEGERVIILEDSFDEEDGSIDDKAFKVDKIDNSIDDRTFENWEKLISNRIRKAAYALPAVLIDYEESKLGTTSGEGIRAAIEFYNDQTEDLRNDISELLRDLLGNFNNEDLRSNTDWKILKL